MMREVSHVCPSTEAHKGRQYPTSVSRVVDRIFQSTDLSTDVTEVERGHEMYQSAGLLAVY